MSINNVVFDVMELEILAIYECETKEETLSYVNEAMEFVDSSDKELLEIMASAAKKLEQISEEEFKDLDLNSYLWEEELDED